MLLIFSLNQQIINDNAWSIRFNICISLTTDSYWFNLSDVNDVVYKSQSFSVVLYLHWSLSTPGFNIVSDYYSTSAINQCCRWDTVAACSKVELVFYLIFSPKGFKLKLSFLDLFTSGFCNLRFRIHGNLFLHFFTVRVWAFPWPYTYSTRGRRCEREERGKSRLICLVDA